MRSRSILQWASLTAVFIIAVFILSGFITHDAASAAITETRFQTQGSLQVVDDKAKLASECPLKHTAVKAEVSGSISRVTVTQDFENPFPDKIEGVYIFPLPQATAIDDLTMLIGDRSIKGKIMRREDAHTAYAEAKQLGKIAALLDQERPNIFTQQVANILPGQKIRIIIRYVDTLKYEDGSYEWSFPMVAAPRYISPSTQADSAHDMQTDARAVNDAARISPPSAPDGVRAGYDISLEIDLDAGVPLLGINSDSHETEFEMLSDRRAVVQLTDRATIPNKDFVLKYRVAGSSINDAVLTHRTERGGFFTLILQPPQRVSAEDVMPKELVFVLDFDARHRLTGFISYDLPALMSRGIGNKLSRNWTIDSIFKVRSSKPVNVLYLFPTSFGVAFLRPDLVNGAPLYVLDPAAPGGRRINAAAFSDPTGLHQGTLGRNSLRGFPLYQIDLGLRRKFSFTEAVALEIGADSFNVFNHANFQDPRGNDVVIGSRFGAAGSLTPNLAFGESTSLSGRNLSSGGFASFYGSEGARAMRFSVKLLF